MEFDPSVPINLAEEPPPTVEELWLRLHHLGIQGVDHPEDDTVEAENERVLLSASLVGLAFKSSGLIPSEDELRLFIKSFIQNDPTRVVEMLFSPTPKLGCLLVMDADEEFDPDNLNPKQIGVMVRWEAGTPCLMVCVPGFALDHVATMMDADDFDLDEFSAFLAGVTPIITDVDRGN